VPDPPTNSGGPCDWIATARTGKVTHGIFGLDNDVCKGSVMEATVLLDVMLGSTSCIVVPQNHEDGSQFGIWWAALHQADIIF
jgi:hypothetical protein